MILVLCSGGHYNPAVSLGLTLVGALRPALCVLYFIAQLLGGLLGAGIVRVNTHSLDNIALETFM